jgi:hypothetical protein
MTLEKNFIISMVNMKNSFLDLGIGSAISK